MFISAGDYSSENILRRKRKDVEIYEFEYNMNINDILAAQWNEQICSHIDIINRYKVKLFIELGMYMGGTLPHIIPNLMLDDEFRYLGFEIGSHTVKPKIMEFASQNPRCQVVIGDMFSDANMTLIQNSIQACSSPVYVFCDGGNKPRELMTFSQYLRPGDIISVHDYTDEQTGEIKDADLDRLDNTVFIPLDERWRKGILWLPTFRRIR